MFSALSHTNVKLLKSNSVVSPTAVTARPAKILSQLELSIDLYILFSRQFPLICTTLSFCLTWTTAIIYGVEPATPTPAKLLNFKRELCAWFVISLFGNIPMIFSISWNMLKFNVIFKYNLPVYFYKSKHYENIVSSHNRSTRKRNNLVVHF